MSAKQDTQEKRRRLKMLSNKSHNLMKDLSAPYTVTQPQFEDGFKAGYLVAQDEAKAEIEKLRKQLAIAIDFIEGCADEESEIKYNEHDLPYSAQFVLKALQKDDEVSGE